MAANLSSRLTITARAIAQLLASSDITLDQLRTQMRRAIAEAHTVELLVGTDGQRSAAIDTALREIIEEEYAELERLITLLEGGPVDNVERRLTAFADTLDDTRAEGQRLIEGDDLSPLIPIAIGTGLGALINGRRQQPAPAPVTRLPRIDSRQLRTLQELFGQRLDVLADDLSSGSLSADAWHEAMQAELRLIHETYAQAGGGRASQARIDAQLEFLNGFRGDVEGLSPEQVKRRARQYIGNAQATMQEAAIASLGIPALPAMPKDGSTECLDGCKCWWRIDNLDGNGNWDVYWTLRPAEHCPNCVNRDRLWSPITIRNGIIQPFETVGVFV